VESVTKMGILKRLVDFLAPLGALVFLGALVWSRSGRVLPGGARPWLIAGLALILVHLILRWEDVAGGIGRRQWKYGTNAVVLSIAVLGILGVANYLVARHTKRWDLTENKRYSLSDQTRKVVGGLQDDIVVTYFQRTLDMRRGEDRLKEYQALSPHLKVEFVDPVKSPQKAQAYDVRGPWPIIIVEHGGKRERVTNDSEEDLTNALIKVTREGTKTVCFVEGEGERSPSDSSERGLTGAKAALEKSLYEVKDVFLLREKQVPADCTVAVVAGPENDLETPTIDALRTFVKGGGKALFMIEPPFKHAYPNIVGLLKEWKIDAGDDVVVDVSGMGQLFGASELAPLVTDYPYHAITKDFRVMTLFGGARSMQAGDETREGVTSQNLARTSPQSWAESDVKAQGEITLDETTGDRTGPIALAAVATISAPSPTPSPSPSPAAEGEEGEAKEEPAKAPEGRVAAFGDVDFASNALLGFQGNQDFFLNTVAWLSEDADLISIRPKEPEDQRLTMTLQQQQNATWLARLVFPLLFVVAGVVVWWRRR